jgi:hypothetical protein
LRGDLARSLDSLLKLRRAPELVDCPSSVLAGPLSAAGDTLGSSASPNETNEPIVGRDIVTNENTDARELVTNEADAYENVTNEATVVCGLGTNEPTLSADVGLESPTYIKALRSRA